VTLDPFWPSQFQLDIDFGYVAGADVAPRRYNPRLVLNADGSTVEHALLEELRRCDAFTFSVAFISPSAIAQLKQHLYDFNGEGRIITSDFLTFNQPEAFAELLKLREHAGVDVRRHTARGFHPKGYIFEQGPSVTAMIGSSNLTNQALSRNHEWNLKVSAARGSDLADQIERLLEEQVEGSEPLTEEWIEAYADVYVAPPRRGPMPTLPEPAEAPVVVRPNTMQQDALLALDLARADGARRAIVISATGTGKTILSALDVRSAAPRRMLFIAHREQILDRTVEEYRRLLGGPPRDFGKLTGNARDGDRRYVFATIQTLSQPHVLDTIARDAFDYVIIDEAHRAGSTSYQRVIDRLTPAFLLGMTATPERTDGFNVFELFDHCVPYEIRLNHALEAEMLSPFHYYGVSDITYDDGRTTGDASELSLLITPERVRFLVEVLEKYGQARVAPCGLIFCSRKEEAHALAAALNEHELNGRALRTVALTGDDSIAVREQRVAELQAGDLDYLLTVDIFNEGVDIPRINQVVMLRQTQSAIVFVQQLGRGLRLAEGKDYLVVIDVIGNYTNNFLIPIALFGDESLNRESLRERLNETVESSALPGLSSVSFDEVSRDRILRSIEATALDNMRRLKSALEAMQHRVGGIPKLWDFHRFESVDPVLLATKVEHYPGLVQRLLRIDSQLSPRASRALGLLSHEVLAAKRLQEFVVLRLLREGSSVSRAQIAAAFTDTGLESGDGVVQSALDTLALAGYAASDIRRYVDPIISVDIEVVRLTDDFRAELESSERLQCDVDDLLLTGEALTRSRYRIDLPFTTGLQYSRRDAARIIGWPRSTSSTIYGYKTDRSRGVCAVFVTLHKSEDVDASTAYEDVLLDETSMRWFSRSRRTLASDEVKAIVDGDVGVHVFVKKDDVESDHYYLGVATAHDAVQTTMPDKDGVALPVVTMTLRFAEAISQGLYDYFRP
jgi:superfamily II DNA or RNA helicase/HKD family nuclease